MQVTAKKSLFLPKKMLYEKVGEVVKDKAIETVSIAVNLSPVDTGAFVESWQVNPRGDRTALARSAAGRPSLPASAKQAKREQEKTRLIERIGSFDTENLDGFTLTNRAPHIPLIELNNRLRTGRKPTKIFEEIRAILKDMNR
jgi:hypothetical protein